MLKALAILLLLTAAAKADPDPPRLPTGVTCEHVKAMVAEHGKILALAWARLQGYSRRDIEQAKRCLR
jgi:hypothetical protein